MPCKNDVQRGKANPKGLTKVSSSGKAYPLDLAEKLPHPPNGVDSCGNAPLLLERTARRWLGNDCALIGARFPGLSVCLGSGGPTSVPSRATIEIKSRNKVINGACGLTLQSRRHRKQMEKTRICWIGQGDMLSSGGLRLIAIVHAGWSTQGVAARLRRQDTAIPCLGGPTCQRFTWTWRTPALEAVSRLTRRQAASPCSRSPCPLAQAACVNIIFLPGDTRETRIL